MAELRASGLPARLALARLPTPIEDLRVVSRALGRRVRVKRDDLTDLIGSGNKLRKLEFLAQEAVRRRADVLLTCGGAQSNHARATAYVARRLRMACRLLLIDPPPRANGNLLLDGLLGATVVPVTPREYDAIDSRMDEEAARLRRSGLRPYVIPEGGSNALGACGYALAMEELLGQLGRHRLDRQTIVVAVGSGGTYAGLLLGKKRLGLKTRLLGINVCDDAAYFQSRIAGILTQARSLLGWGVGISPAEIDIRDGYVGRGYALSRPEELRLLVRLAREEALLLDPVYTGKAFFGLLDLLGRTSGALGKEILFLHTGGVFSLFARQRQLWNVVSAEAPRMRGDVASI